MLKKWFADYKNSLARKTATLEFLLPTLFIKFQTMHLG